MNMKKLALAAAVAALSTSAIAAQELTIDTGLSTLITDLSANTGNFEGSFQNLAINNADLVDAAVTLVTGSSILSDAQIATTSIGAVQAGNVALVVSTATSNDSLDTSTTTNTTTNTLTDLSERVTETSDNVTDTSSTTNDIVTATSNAAAHTSSTATSQALDDSTDASSTATNIVAVKETSDTINTNLETVNDTVNNTENNIDSVVTTARTSSFAAANVAYNNAGLDASVDFQDNSINGLIGVQLGQTATITTTAIGAVQNGNITVTVQ